MTRTLSTEKYTGILPSGKCQQVNMHDRICIGQRGTVGTLSRFRSRQRSGTCWVANWAKGQRGEAARWKYDLSGAESESWADDSPNQPGVSSRCCGASAGDSVYTHQMSIHIYHPLVFGLHAAHLDTFTFILHYCRHPTPACTARLYRNRVRHGAPPPDIPRPVPDRFTYRDHSRQIRASSDRSFY